jgi:HEAT repeat protein
MAQNVAESSAIIRARFLEKTDTGRHQGGLILSKWKMDVIKVIYGKVSGQTIEVTDWQDPQFRKEGREVIMCLRTIEGQIYSGTEYYGSLDSREKEILEVIESGAHLSAGLIGDKSGFDENDFEPTTKHGNDIVAKKPEDKPIAMLQTALNSNHPVEKTGKSLTDKDLLMLGTRSLETTETRSFHAGTVAPDRGRATLGVVPIDRERMNAEAKKIREMAAAGDIDGLVAMLSAGMFPNKVAAAEHLGEIGDERALPELIKLKERFICGLSKDGSTVFRKDGWGYRQGISSGAFAVAICKITTRNLSVKEQIDALFELLDDCIEPEMDSNKPYLALGRHGLLDVPINEFGFGCFDLGKRVAAELEKYDDPSIVTRLRRTENKGAAITAVWMEVRDMVLEKAIERCVEIATKEHEAQQYGAIKCLGKLGEDAIFALDDLAMEGHYEAMRTLGYRKKNPEVLIIICWHLTNNRNFLVRLLAVSQFSHMNILQYQQPILLQTLVEALYDPHESIRRRAASLLRTIAEGKNGSQLLEYEDDLLIALKHPDKEVRGFTAQTLNRLGSKRLNEEVPDPPEIRTDLK